MLLAVAACHSWSGANVPGSFAELPWRGTENDAAVLAARALVEHGEGKQALAMVEAVLQKEPRHVDAQRLRQDVMRERGRRGRLWWEAETAVAKAPDDPEALYLLGRVVADPREKERLFERAATLAPDSIWPWLGLAHTVRSSDPDRSLDIYRRLYVSSEAHPLVGVAFAALLRERERHDEAAAIYRHLQSAVELPGVGDLGLAQVRFAQDRQKEAWPALLAALQKRPHDPAVQGLLRGWLAAGASQEQVAQVFDVLREDPRRVASLCAGDGEALLAELLLRTMQPQAALSLLESSAVSARQPALRRLQRRLLLALGDVKGCLALVQKDLPVALIAAETNQLRVRWMKLLDGPWHDGDPLESPDVTAGLLDALRSVGWLVEVESLAGVAIRRWPNAASRFETVRDDVRREIAFEAGLRRVLYHGYELGDRRSLTDVVEDVRRLSMQIWNRDVVGEPKIWSVPMVGELLDSFEGRLVEHFDRYNRHLVIGRRSGGTTEGMLFTRLSVSELPASRELALPGRCFEVVGIDRDVRALAGVLGGDIAGVALLNHFLIDFDAVRDWARTVADRRRVVAEDGNGLRDDPFPAGAGDDPLDAPWRLACASPVPDDELEVAVLDSIRQHERQHLVDSFHYLPVESNLWRSVGLLLQFGLSPSAIESEMERRAELASLATAPHTELVLAHIADFLSEPGVVSPHHQGFGELGRQITVELRALGLSAEAAMPSRWHLVDRGLVREAARRLLARL